MKSKIETRETYYSDWKVETNGVVPIICSSGDKLIISYNEQTTVGDLKKEILTREKLNDLSRIEFYLPSSRQKADTGVDNTLIVNTPLAISTKEKRDIKTGELLGTRCKEDKIIAVIIPPLSNTTRNSFFNKNNSTQDDPGVKANNIPPKT